ncbi:acyl carrier protein [Streptomyces olivoreticuli]|uniref:acyl carrier protein n=1 Tax=Streptomyces olivoreticuli TaxID=68246 RepID=UPI00265A3A4F|nr:acyl carrier protein [Streptomyces olivoreticuli]WKK26818.1 acyl carrier protein [Streptomyces olivoreticuli]
MSAGATDPVRDELTAIWQDVFKVTAEEIDPDEGFFELGGTSLQAVQLMTRIEKAFDVKIPLPVIFTEGSVAGLTAIVEEELLSGADELTDEEALRLLEEHQEAGEERR